MSQDGNNNLFGNPNFQTSPFDPSSLYHPDMASMQFASSVPHRQPSPPQIQHVSMNFSPFGNQDVMAPHPQFSMGYPGSPYERPESSTSVKQIQTKAERRAEHNATERARRENLNVKFQQLAFTLPNLQNDSRPSKGTIIDRTLDFVKGAIIKEERMQYRINELEKFSRYLLSELDKKNNNNNNTTTTTTKEQEELISSPPTIPMTSPTHSALSDDTTNTEDNNNIKPELFNNINIKKVTNISRQKENGITKRRPVSRTSVSMIPKLDYATSWPTTTATTTPTTKNTTSSPPKPSSNYQHNLIIEQQQQQQQQQQQLIKEQSTPTTTMLFQPPFQPQPILFQQQKYSEPQQQDNFMLDGFNNPANTYMINTNSFNHQIMEQQQHLLQHRR